MYTVGNTLKALEGIDEKYYSLSSYEPEPGALRDFKVKLYITTESESMGYYSSEVAVLEVTLLANDLRLGTFSLYFNNTNASNEFLENIGNLS